MDNFIKYILQFGNLNPEQIALVKSKIKERIIPKDDFYIEAGKIQKEISFITKGVMRICYYDKGGNEITKYFIDENHFAVDINSYTFGIPTSEYGQAITDCHLIIISKDDMMDLSMTIIQWDEIIQRITAKGLSEKISKISTMLAEDATQRYLNFLDKFPTLANRVPLSYLASYLGITQSSLSRIRKNILQ